MVLESFIIRSHQATAEAPPSFCEDAPNNERIILVCVVLLVLLANSIIYIWIVEALFIFNNNTQKNSLFDFFNFFSQFQLVMY